MSKIQEQPLGGEMATICTMGNRESIPITGPLADIAREFISQNSQRGGKIYGQAGFNYAAYVRGQAYNPGEWPLLSLMAPCTETTLHRSYITVLRPDDDRMRELCYLLKSSAIFHPPPSPNINMRANTGNYTTQVATALSEIAKGQYTKVIVSRAVDLEDKVDMPATLLWGRCGNTPARTFSLNHEGFEATGFSPERVVLVEDGKVITEPLAGTRSHIGTDAEVEKLRLELLSDTKEIVEHIVSVKEANKELGGVCKQSTVVVEDLMTVRGRGSVQHLGSRVSGSLSPGTDCWDAFDVLFPAITPSGIPKDAAIEAIQNLESRPRELYSGTVLLIEGTVFFEAMLVLRTVFQDKRRQWIQAGAGIISQSDPQRELIETREKLASITPFLVAKVTDEPIQTSSVHNTT